MKSEHRRELHANELEKLTQSLGRFFEKHGMKILLGLVAAIAVTLGVFWFLGRGNTAREQGTTQLITAADASDFLTVADNPDLAGLPYTPAARVRAAELQLKTGINLYFQNREAGQKALKSAQDNFKQALDSEKLPAGPRERALYGLAVATEALSGGDTRPAIAAYKRLLDSYPESVYKEIANGRIKLLETPAAREFYAFMATHPRKPGDLKTPGDLQRNRAAHAGRDVYPSEKPVELPQIPNELMRDLDPPKKRNAQKPPEKKDSAKPFPPSKKEGTAKPPAGKSKPKAKPQAAKQK